MLKSKSALFISLLFAAESASAGGLKNCRFLTGNGGFWLSFLSPFIVNKN